MSIRIDNTDNATIESIAAEADKLYQYAIIVVEDTQKSNNTWTVNDCETLHHVLAEKCPNFAQSYPLVLRTIADCSYVPIVFRRYLEKVKKRPWTTEEEFLRSSTDYYVMITKHHDSKLTNSKIRKLRREIYKKLLKETEDFKAKVMDAEKRVNQQITESEDRRREELVKVIEEYGGNPILDRVDPTYGETVNADFSVADSSPEWQRVYSELTDTVTAADSGVNADRYIDIECDIIPMGAKEDVDYDKAGSLQR